MDVVPETTGSETKECENCFASVPLSQKFCSQCSFPTNGTAEEKGRFRLHIDSRKRFLKDAHDKIKTSKIIMFVLAGLFFVIGLVMGLGSDDVESMIINVFLCLIYLVLAAWCTTNPFGATLTALIIYGTLIVVNGFIDPTTIFKGIIMKFFIVAALAKGIRSAQDAQKHLQELEKIKAAPGHGYE